MSLPTTFFIGRGGAASGPLEIVSGSEYVEDTGLSYIFSLPTNVSANATRSQIISQAKSISSFSSFYIREPERLNNIRMGGGRGGLHLSSGYYGGRGMGLNLTFTSSNVTTLQGKTNTLCYVGYGMGGHDYQGNYQNCSVGGACSYIGFDRGSSHTNHDLMAVAAGAGGGPYYTSGFNFNPTGYGDSDADWSAGNLLSQGQYGSTNDQNYRTGGGMYDQAGSSNDGYGASGYSSYAAETRGGWLVGGHTNYDGGGGGAGAYGGGGGFDFSGSDGGSGGGGCSLRNSTYCNLNAYYMAGSEVDGINTAGVGTAINYGWRCEVFYT